MADWTQQTLRGTHLFSSGHPAVLAASRRSREARKTLPPRALDASFRIVSKERRGVLGLHEKTEDFFTMLHARTHRWTAIAIALALSACGYSQEEWDGKVRENAGLRDQLTTQRQAHKK